MAEPGRTATHVRRIIGTADLHTDANSVEIAYDTADHALKFHRNGTTDAVVALGGTQTITGDKTLSGTVSFTGATTKTGIVEQHAHHAKIGAGAGFAVDAADNKNSLARCPASQTAATLVVPLSVRVGDVLTGYYLVGQIESAGGIVTVDAALRKQTAAAADLTDAAVTSGGITQLSVTADTIISATNAGVTGLAVTVAANETYYVLITVTTAASTDVDLQSVNLTKTAV